ncbi:MAG: hypothetical protein C4576_24045 [Desulfobacteraceae bacterium]|nr:MAG: hypothetical protein C4576_24045 [Desulfobacteraceae bacterium]
MIVKCLACRQEMVLNDAKFQNYQGPVKCFGCGAKMNLRSVRGVVGSVDQLGGAGDLLQKASGWRSFKKVRPPFGVPRRFSG